MPNQLTKDQIDKNTELLIKASQKGDVDEVKRLISVSDPKANDSQALQQAATNGHLECVKLLIPVSDPKAKNSYALQWAVRRGRIEIVKLLIPLSEPKAEQSLALQYATHQKHIEIVKFLAPVSDYLKAEQDMMVKNWDTTLLRQYIDEYEALQQKERLTHQLNSSVNHTQHSSVKRKM